MVSQKRIDEIYNNYPASFKALEEFEKTGKIILKKRMNFTIDREISKQFREYCEKNGKTMSELIEKYMKKTIIK